MKKATYILVFWLCASFALGQNIENIVKAKPLKLTGFVNGGMSYLEDNRESNFISPFGYYATVGLNLNIYDALHIPVSFTYSDQQSSFSRPSFKTFGISPTYKWATIHIGYRSFNISPLLMSGTMLKGYGIELKPGNFNFTFFRGNLSHQYNFGYNNEIIAGNEIHTYKRNTYGAKIGLGNGRNFVKLSMIKVEDDALTGDLLALDTLSIYPQENFGLALAGGANFFKILTLEANVAGSALSSDQNALIVETEGFFKKVSDAFMELNESTRYAFAYDGSVTLDVRPWRFGFKYQHIDPNYETLGFLYLQQDLDNYTFFLSTSMFQSKLIFNGNVGFQYNNTKEYFAQKDRRVIYNASMNWTINPALQWALSYNNYNTEGNLSVTEVVDSLQFTTGNTGISSSLNYQFGPKKGKHNINLNFARNKFNLIRNKEIFSENTSSNYSLSYSKKLKEKGLTLGASVRLSDFNNEDGNSVGRKGISLKFKKDLSKKVSIRLRPSYDINSTNGINDGSVINLKFRSSYKVSQKTNISAFINYRNRKTTIIRPFSQIRFSLSFNARF